MVRALLFSICFALGSVCAQERSAPAASATVDESGYIHYDLGMRYKAEQRHDLALDEFKKVLADYPDNYNAYMQIAEIHSAMDRPKLVIFDLQKALSYNPGWGRARKLLAKAYRQDGQLEKALLELQNYVQSCDPAEQSTIQSEIDELLALLGGKPAAVAAVKKPAPVLHKEKISTPAPPVAHASVPAKAVAHPTAHTAPTATPLEHKGPLVDTIKTTPAMISLVSPAAQTAFNEGVRLYTEGMYDSALTLLKDCLTLQPGYAGAYYYAGVIRRRQGLNDKAKTNFEKSFAYPELGHNAHFYLGKIYAEEKNYPKAISELEKYASHTSFDAGKKEAETLMGRYRTFVKVPEKKDTVIEVKPVDAAAVAAGDMKIELSQIRPEAPVAMMEVRIDSLLSMMILDTVTPQGRSMLTGVQEFTNGRFDNSIREFKKVQVQYPAGDVNLYCAYDIGICYLKMRLFPAAENQFNTIIERSPTHKLAPKSLFMKAISYSGRHEPITAEKLYREFIQKYPKHEWVSRAYEKLGDSYRDLDQPSKAIDAYQAGLNTTGNNADIVSMNYKLGDTYMQLSNNDRAMTAFAKAIDIGEKNSVFVRVPDSYYKVADYYYGLKKYPEALEKYQAATRKYPQYQDCAWGLFQIGNVYKNQKNFRMAIDTYKDLIKRFPDDYWAKQAQWKMDDAIWEHEYQAVLK